MLPADDRLVPASARCAATRPSTSTASGTGTGIVNLDGRGMLLVSVAQRFRVGRSLLAYCAAPSNRAGPQKGALAPLS
jgi:hypothetical protein